MPEVDTVLNTLRLLPHDSRWAVKHICIEDEGQSTAAAICNGTAVAVSDGSLKFGIGSSAFIISNPSCRHAIVGGNIIPGPVKDGDSHRCELAGIYGILIVVDTLVQRFEISQGAVHIACDNEQALQVLHPDFLPDPQYANFDLVNSIFLLLKQSPLSWTYEHVYGHQDSRKLHRPLTRLKTLNVSMDHLAKSIWQYHASSPGDTLDVGYSPIRGEGWQLWSGLTKVTHPSNAVLYEYLQDNLTQMWWVRRNVVTKPTLEEIDWDGTKNMMQSITPAERRYVTKHSSNNFGVGSTLVEWKFQSDATCPRCDA